MGLSAEIADLTFTVTAAAIETAEHNVTTSDTTSNVPIMIDESRKALTALAALGPPLVALDELGTTRVETGVHTVDCDADDNEMAEREEGELSDDITGDDVGDADEYEAISSDEEFKLRQKIEALEARNFELEQIASISAKAHDSYDTGPRKTQISTPTFLAPSPVYAEDKYYVPPNYQSYGKNPDWTSPTSFKYPHSHSKKYSSAKLLDDEKEQFVDNRGTPIRKFPKNSSKKSSHRKDKGSKTKRRYYDNLDGDADIPKFDRKKMKKRRGAGVEFEGDRNRSGHHVHVYSSSDDDCIETTTREELRAALNIKLDRSDGLGSTTLEHKLKTELGLGKQAGIRKTRSKSNDQCDHDRGKRRLKIDKKATVETVDIDSDSSVYVASKEISDLFETLTQEKLIDSDRMKMTVVERRQFPHDIWKSRSYDSNQVLLTRNGRINVNPRAYHDDLDDDDDETVSLEEQELRLIALKSAVLKKHEARKKRRIAQDDRPYSPTDNLLTPDRVSDIEDNSNVDVIDSDNNNMEISPAMSPNSTMVHKVESECQPMDMELALSDESRSPIFFNEMPLHIENARSGCDTSIDASQSHVPNRTVAIDVASAEVSEAPSAADDDETALRAILIANMKTTKKGSNTTKSNRNPVSKLVITANDQLEKVAADVSIDESSEADYLRSLLLSSIKNKKEKLQKRKLSESSKCPSESTTADKLGANNQTIEPPSKKANSIPLPQLACHLKQALKRIQYRNHNELDADDIACDETSEQDSARIPEKADLSLTQQTVAKEEQIAPVETQTTAVGSNILTPTNKLTPKSQQPFKNDSKILLEKAGTTTKAKTAIKPAIQPPQKPASSKLTANTPAIASKPANTAKVTNTMSIKPNAAGSPTVKTKAILTTATTKNTPSQKINTVILKKIATSDLVSPILVARTSTPIVKTAAALAAKQRNIASPTVAKLPTSKLILVAEPKPVSKMIISINQSSSSSEWSYDSGSSDDDDNEVAQLNRSTAAFHNFDNTSPGCFAMDGPSSASNSPAVDFRPIEANKIAKDNNNDANVVDKAINGVVDENNDTFQLKLNEYLRKLRTTVSKNEKAAVPSNGTKTQTQIDEKAVGASLVKEKVRVSSVKSVLKKVSNESVPPSKQNTPLAVRHLPASAQLEYRQLINRMKLLEKQKEQKLLNKPPEPKPTTMISTKKLPTNMTAMTSNVTKKSPLASDRTNPGNNINGTKLQSNIAAKQKEPNKPQLKPLITMTKQPISALAMTTNVTNKSPLVLAGKNSTTTNDEKKLSSTIANQQNEQKLRNKSPNANLPTMSFPNSLSLNSTSATSTATDNTIQNNPSAPAACKHNETIGKTGEPATSSASTAANARNESPTTASTFTVPTITVTVQNDNYRRVTKTTSIFDQQYSEQTLQLTMPPAASPTEVVSAAKEQNMRNTAHVCSSTTSDSIMESAARPISPTTMMTQTASPAIRGEASEWVSNTSEALPAVDLLHKSDAEKTEMLKSTENSYIQHSSKFISDLESLHQLVCSANRETQKQRDLEMELEQIRAKYKLISEQLLLQRSITQNKYPVITETEKNMLSVRRNWRISQKLATDCLAIGREVKGRDYRVPGNSKEIITNRLRSISMETQQLRLMKATAAATPLPVNLLNDSPCHATAPMNDSLVPNSSDPVIEATSSFHSDERFISSEKPYRTLQLPSAARAHDGNDEHSDFLLITVRNELAEQNAQQSSVTAPTAAVFSMVQMELMNDDSRIAKYSSPLDHLHNNNGSPIIRPGLSDGDSIVCPYQLNGVCMDKDCIFQHLSS